jgi:S1-C subfamily serine protease
MRVGAPSPRSAGQAFQPGSRRSSAARSGMDAAVLAGALGEVLADDVGEPVDGLLGYSFLKHFRIALDFPRGLLWLDPSRGDVRDRLEEYSHPGLQLESVDERVRVFAVAEGSPAARAGIRVGDELVAINGESVSDLDVVTVARRLEGASGTTLLLGLRRGQREWICRLVRRRLL